VRLESGQTISRYRLVEPIGEGGMGVVWSAEDLELQRPVALKFLTTETLEREDMRARFLREARTAAALNHPGICTIYEVGEFEGPERRKVPFIAMELIEGRTLEQCLRSEGRHPLSAITRIAEQVAEGLAAAHARGIVHRDLKPANVMLTEDGRAKILDFGLAKPQGPTAGDDAGATAAATISAEMTREGRILGTVSYMSPEQAEGKPVDSRSDVFSFGILLYRLASGELPFSGETSASTLAKILEAEARPLAEVREGLPPDLDRIVRRCLQKRPEQRYNDTRDLVAALRDLRSTGETDVAAPIGTERRRPPVWLWIVALGVVIALALVLSRVGRSPVSAPEAPIIAEKPSVAVLPFHNLSPDTENEYFSAGVTEEIISKLSRIDGLEVASRSSVARYKGPERDARRIGEELGVRFLLDGSVRRSGERVRITAQLVDSSTGRNLWSEDFDGSLEDVFAMQEETALKIAEQLDLQLSPQEARDVRRRSTEDVLAYDAYLRAQALLQGWSDTEKLEAAREQYEMALEHDPDYAPALAGLASVEAEVYRNFDPSEERILRAERLAERALEHGLSPARAHLALGEIAGMRYDYHRAARQLREATRLAPKEPIAWDYLSWVLAYKTPPDAKAAEDAALEALALQPDFPGAYYHLGRAYLHQQRYDEARAAFEQALRLNPDFNAGHFGMAQYYLAIGDFEAALASQESMGTGTAMDFFYTGAIHAAAGRDEDALKSLEDAFGAGFRDFAGLDASPYFDSLRNDPRFLDLARRYRN
jgi:non-specific serine/threonine protein kinase